MGCPGAERAGLQADPLRDRLVAPVPSVAVIERIVNICRKIEQSYSPDMIVVACNLSA